MNPIIGILTEVDDELTTKVRASYINAVEKSGGVPVVLPYVKDERTIEDFADVCDGFLFTGGVDVEPSRYGEEAKPTCEKPQLYRDELEFCALEVALRRAKPILAICRGAQLVNAALGGTLYQDIQSECPSHILHRQTEPENSPSHSVKALEGTPLFEIMKTEKVTANSFHHQAIKTLGDGLEAMAVAEDGIIEAYYSTTEKYIRAYQWHPERLFDSDLQNRLIFEDFMSAVEARKS